MAAEKRVVFRSGWLPWALVGPQAAVILVFFFWPAAQTLLQSIQRQDAFGTSTEWVGLANFAQIFSDPSYLASFKTTALFSVLVAVVGIAVSLLLAVFADRVIRVALVYKTLLIWPYAVAPAVAGVLWLFMFAPSVGVVSYALHDFLRRLRRGHERHVDGERDDQHPEHQHEVREGREGGAAFDHRRASEAVHGRLSTGPGARRSGTARP